MATQPEPHTPADIVKEQKRMKEQDKEVSNTMPPPEDVPAGNPEGHPTRRNRKGTES